MKKFHRLVFQKKAKICFSFIYPLEKMREQTGSKFHIWRITEIFIFIRFQWDFFLWIPLDTSLNGSMSMHFQSSYQFQTIMGQGFTYNSSPCKFKVNRSYCFKFQWLTCCSSIMLCWMWPFISHCIPDFFSIISFMQPQKKFVILWYDVCAVAVCRQ